MHTSKKLIANKLCRLSFFLHHATEEFNQVSSHIKEKKIKISVRSIAARTEQYMNELDSQLSMLSIKCAIKGNNREIKSSYAEYKNISDKKILELYCNSESFFSKAYNSILNQYFPQKPLRDMLRYQLTGIRNAFRELKLLNSVTRERSIEVPVI